MLWLDDLSNEGHIPAIYHDDPDDRRVFVKRGFDDTRHRSTVAAERGCVPVMRGLEWIDTDSYQGSPWDGETVGKGRKAGVRCRCA